MYVQILSTIIKMNQVVNVKWNEVRNHDSLKKNSMQIIIKQFGGINSALES